MKKLLLLAFVLSPFGCGDRDRIYKGDDKDGDITIIRDLGGSSCVCQAGQPCQCVPPVPQQPGQPGKPQHPNQPTVVPVPPCTQSPCQGNNQLGQPVNITINNNSNASNTVDMNQCQRSYSFNTNKTFTRQVTCQDGTKCKAQGTWTPIQQKQQPGPWEPVPTTQYNLEYGENSCGDCQSEIVTI